MKDLDIWGNKYIWLFLMSTCVQEPWSMLEDSLNSVWSIIEEQPFVRVNY